VLNTASGAREPVVDSNAAATMAAWASRPGRAVIFDFNGTLSDDEGILLTIYTEIFGAHLGWRITEAEYLAHCLGRSDREIVESAVRDRAGGDAELAEALLGLRRDMYKEIVADHSPITADAAALVGRLADAGTPMAIVTGAQRADVMAVLDNCGTGDLIKLLVTEEDVSIGKPDPEGFLRGAELLGVDPADVLVFEDSMPGIRGAERAGMRCIAVTGDPPNLSVQDAAPAHVVRLTPALLDGTGL
jgi:beta-phosphoglucomutase